MRTPTATIEISSDEVFVATGRRPNTDVLDGEAAGIDTDDDAGFVETDEYMERTAKNVWALGDIAGGPQFKHAATREAECVAANAVEDRGEEIEYPGMAHAIFTSQEIASTGKTESELADDRREYDVGRQAYDDTPIGRR